VLDTAAILVRSSKAHARVSNRLHDLEGVDGRSAAGKRYRDILDSLVLEFGSHDPVRLRELAGVRYTLEQVQGDIIAGDVAAREHLVRLSNLAVRLERRLAAKARKALEQKQPTLAELIAASPRMTRAEIEAELEK
jgi:hypothetical protein